VVSNLKLAQVWELLNHLKGAVTLRLFFLLINFQDLINNLDFVLLDHFLYFFLVSGVDQDLVGLLALFTSQFLTGTAEED
jgi:hypothetical protein